MLTSDELRQFRDRAEARKPADMEAVKRQVQLLPDDQVMEVTLAGEGLLIGYGLEEQPDRRIYRHLSVSRLDCRDYPSPTAMRVLLIFFDFMTLPPPQIKAMWAKNRGPTIHVMATRPQ